MIKAKVKYTEKHFKSILSKKTSWISKFYIFIILAFMIYSLFMNIYNNGVNLKTIYPVIFWIIVILIIKYLFSAKRQFKNYQKNFPNTVNTYCFDEEKFLIESVSDGSRSYNEYSYDWIISSEEKNGYFHIQVKSVGTLIICFDEIIEGTSDELKKLLNKS